MDYVMETKEGRKHIFYTETETYMEETFRTFTCIFDARALLYLTKFLWLWNIIFVP